MADPLRLYLDPAEIHELTGYPFRWSQHDPNGVELPIKDLVREQMGHRCERCGHPYRKGEHGNGQWSPCDQRCTHLGSSKPGVLTNDWPLAEWRILTVHHLNGIKHDCRWWNLAALCQRCHLTIQAKVYMQRWSHPFPHTPWFRPHAAGWYAVKYLGADLTREESALREAELLALEQTHAPLF